MKDTHTKSIDVEKYFEPIDYNGSKYSRNQNNYDNLPDTERALHLDMLIRYYGIETLNEQELSEVYRLALVEHESIGATKLNNWTSQFAGLATKFLVAQSILALMIEGVDTTLQDHPLIDLPNGRCLTIALSKGSLFRKDLTYTKCWDRPCNDSSVNPYIDYNKQDLNEELSGWVSSYYRSPSYAGTKVVGSNAVEVVYRQNEGVSGRVTENKKTLVLCGESVVSNTTEIPQSDVNNESNGNKFWGIPKDILVLVTGTLGSLGVYIYKRCIKQDTLQNDEATLVDIEKGQVLDVEQNLQLQEIEPIGVTEELHDFF